MKGITDRQAAVLRYVHDSLRDLGTTPSVRQLCAVFAIASTQGAQRHLDALLAKGYLERTNDASRWRVTDAGRTALQKTA